MLTVIELMPWDKIAATQAQGLMGGWPLPIGEAP